MFCSYQETSCPSFGEAKLEDTKERPGMRVELPPGNSTEQEYLSKAENNTKRKDKDHSSESFGNTLTKRI